MGDLVLDIQPRIGFDLQSHVNGALAFMNEDCVLYASGRHLAVHNFTADAFDGGEYLEQTTGFLLREPKKKHKRKDDDEEGTMERETTIEIVDENSSLTSFCLNPNQRHLAIAESSPNKPFAMISVFDVRGAGQGDKLLCPIKSFKSKILLVSKSHVQGKDSTSDESTRGSNGPHEVPVDKLNQESNGHSHSHTHLAFSSITLMTFSKDGRYLAVIGDGPTHPLGVWEWMSHPRLMGMPWEVGSEIKSVHFNPHNHNEVITCGPEVLWRWTIGVGKTSVEKEVTHRQVLAVGENEKLRDFCYFQSRRDMIAVCRSAGTVNEILLMCNKEILHTVNVSDLTVEINCIAPIKDGFAVGCLGKLLYYQFRNPDTIRTKEGDQDIEETSLFRRKYHIEHGKAADKKKAATSVFLAKCIHMNRPLTGKKDVSEPLRPKELVLSPNSEILGVVSYQKDVFTLYLEAMELLEQDEVQHHMNFVKSGLHNHRIIDSDVCEEQPLVATCCDVDCSVRLWNYAEQQNVTVKVFEEPPTCVAIHRSGFELAVGFKSTILFFRITIDELVYRGEVSQKNFSKILYSNSGHMLAAASNRGVLVYASNTLKTVAKFKGHQDQITSMAWSDNDETLTTVGAGGGVYRWNILQHRRVLEFMSDNLNYSSVVLSPKNNFMVVAGVHKHGTEMRHTIQYHRNSSTIPFNGFQSHIHYLDPPEEEGRKFKKSVIEDTKPLIEQLTNVELHMPHLPEPYISPSNSPLHKRRSLSASLPTSMAKEHQCYSANSSTYVPNLQLTTICIGREEFLLVGTPKGSIMAYAWPLHPTSECLKEFYLHTDAVTSIKACQKTGVIVSTSLDGSLFMFSLVLVYHKVSHDDILAGRTGVPKLKDIKELVAARERGEDTDHVIKSTSPFEVGKVVATPFTKPLFKPFENDVISKARIQLQKEIEEQKTNDRRMTRKVHDFFGQRKQENEDFNYVLVKKRVFLEKKEQIKKLLRQSKTYELEWEYKMRRDMDGVKKKLVLQKQEFERQLSNSTQKQQMLQQKDKDREAEVAQWLEEVETQHVLAAEALERLYERKLALEAKRFRKLTQNSIDQETGLSLELERTRRYQELNVSQMQKQYDSQLTDCNEKISKMEQKVKEDTQRYVEFLEEVDYDHDMELTKQHEITKNDSQTFNIEIEKMNQRNTILKGQLVHQKQKMKDKSRQQDKKLEEMREIEDERNKAQGEVMKLRQKAREASTLQKKQDQRVLESQAHIIKLTDQNESLMSQVQAFLEEKKLNNVEATKLEIENRIRSLDGEFHAKTQSLLVAERTLKENKIRINNLTNQLNSALKTVSDKEAHITSMREDIMTLKDMGTLRDKYCSREKNKHMDARVENEFIRQTKQYKRTIAFLQQKVAKLDFLVKGAQGRRLNDNIGLMKEINDLRVTNKDFQSEIGVLKSEVEKHKLQQALGGNKAKKDSSSNFLADAAKMDSIISADAYTEMEKMLKASYRRLGQQEEELQSLRKQVSNMASREEAARRQMHTTVLPPPDVESQTIFEHLRKNPEHDRPSSNGRAPTPPLTRLAVDQSATRVGRAQNGRAFARKSGLKTGSTTTREARSSIRARPRTVGSETARVPRANRLPQAKRPASRQSGFGRKTRTLEHNDSNEKFGFLDRAQNTRSDLEDLFDQFDSMEKTS